MGKDCPLLRQLSFQLMGDIPENNNLFSIFSTFKALTTLEIIINTKHLDFGDTNVYNYGSISDLRHLSQLKHLKISVEELNDDIIDSIDKYLPQLVSIWFLTDKAITDKSLEQLSRLKCLTRLGIDCFHHLSRPQYH